MCVMGAVAGMCAAGIADVDGALLDVVAWSSVCRAAVNGVLVVEASASRVELNELIAHGDVCVLCGVVLVDELEPVACRGEEEEEEDKGAAGKRPRVCIVGQQR